MWGHPPALTADVPPQPGTHDDEQDEVDEVVEGVSVHDKVHDVDPALQRDDLGRLQRAGYFRAP